MKRKRAKRKRKPAAKPPFPTRLRVMAEYGSSGIWVDGSVGPFLHAMARHRDLALPADLAARFVSWISWYWAKADKKPLDLKTFNAEGRSLAIALKDLRWQQGRGDL